MTKEDWSLEPSNNYGEEVPEQSPATDTAVFLGC